MLERAHGSMRQKARCALLKEELENTCSRKRCQERARLIKEDLIAAVWHPRRVKKMLDEGGFELIDSY